MGWLALCAAEKSHICSEFSWAAERAPCSSQPEPGLKMWEFRTQLVSCAIMFYLILIVNSCQVLTLQHSPTICQSWLFIQSYSILFMYPCLHLYLHHQCINQINPIIMSNIVKSNQILNQINYINQYHLSSFFVDRQRSSRRRRSITRQPCSKLKHLESTWRHWMTLKWSSGRLG